MSRFQIACAVALRQLPELIPKRDAIEVKVQRVFDAYESSQSSYSDHEMQHLEDKQTAEDSSSTRIIKETAQDKLDRWRKEKSQFRYAEHVERMSKFRYLFIKSKFGSDIKDQWLLPQAFFDRELDDHDLMDTARRALREKLNIINGYTIISRIPSSHYKFFYPKKVRDEVGADGAIVFFLKANLDRPSDHVRQMVFPDKSDKLAWMTKDEATKVVHKDYIHRLALGLLHEDRVNIDYVINKANRYVETSRKVSSSI